MERKAFPVLYVANVRRSVEFFGLLGYESRYQFPLEGDPHYVGLERGESSLGVADSSWPEAQLGITVGTAPRFELFLYEYWEKWALSSSFDFARRYYNLGLSIGFWR